MVDALFEALGFKRIATVEGNVIKPTEWGKDKQCPICGDHDCTNPRSCETGDGE